MMLGKLYRIFSGMDSIKLINTVHDSVIFDCKSTYITAHVPAIKRIMEEVPKYMMEEFGIDFDLPLEVEIKAGPNWGSMEKVA